MRDLLDYVKVKKLWSSQKSIIAESYFYFALDAERLASLGGCLYKSNSFVLVKRVHVSTDVFDGLFG